MFAFPASDEEKQLVHSAILRLQKAQNEATQAAADLLRILEEEALAVDERYLKKHYESTQIGSLMFNVRIRRIKMEKSPERIISEPS